VKVIEKNYPGQIKICYAVNAPKAGKILFATVRPFLSSDSASRIRIFDSNKDKWKEALFQNIELDQVPEFLGGTWN
jgi:hypothetical protein